MNTPLPHALGLQTPDIETRFKSAGFPAFRARQVLQWVFEKGTLDLAEMSNLSKADQEKISALLTFELPTVTTMQQAADGVIKWLLRLHDGHEVEMVYIPETGPKRHRGTLCVSSQVGCTLTCRFCHTGTQGLSRNLEAHEIVAQVFIARQALGDFKNKNTSRKLTNIVFMGMGEPLYNYDNVKKSILILMHQLGFGSRKITLSTSGMAERIPLVGEELGVNLAISLHGTNDELRTRIMPINRKFPLANLMQAVRNFKLKEHRRMTWEYVMLRGVNDTPEHARELLALIRGIPSLVNLIPFNPWPGTPFECSTQADMEAFRDTIAKAGVDVTLRKTRGEDILAACGQLRGETSKFNTVSVEYPTVVAKYGNEKQKVRVAITEV